jgi:hypothetical protein
MANVIIDKHTGGAYADKKEVIKDELRRIRLENPMTNISEQDSELAVAAGANVDEQVTRWWMSFLDRALADQRAELHRQVRAAVKAEKGILPEDRPPTMSLGIWKASKEAEAKRNAVIDDALSAIDRVFEGE